MSFIKTYGWEGQELQEKFCAENNLPYLMQDQRCSSCRENVYEGRKAYQHDRAMTMHITTCPYCGKDHSIIKSESSNE